jgi:anti-anti-sigma factor
MMSELKVRFSRFATAKDVFLAELSGSIDASTVDKFQEELQKARKQGVSRLVLDVAGIKYVNSTGLGSLVKFADTFRSAGGGLVLLKVPPKMKIVIEMLGLHEFFDMCNTSREALAKLGYGVAQAPAPVDTEVPTVVKPVSSAASAVPVASAEPAAPVEEAAAPSGAPPKVAKPSPPQAAPPKAPPVAPAVTKKPPTAPAVPAPKVSLPAKSRVAAPRGYPAILACASCGVDVEIGGAGSYKCPRCGSLIYADGAGNINFYGVKKPIPLQLVLVTDGLSTEALKRFVGAVAEQAGFDVATANAIKSATEEVANVIFSTVYKNNENTYSVLVINEPQGLTIKFADHGERLPQDAPRKLFPQSSLAFEEFEITGHPRGGNLIRLFKKK